MSALCGWRMRVRGGLSVTAQERTLVDVRCGGCVGRVDAWRIVEVA
jgi:hypothetical protein